MEQYDTMYTGLKASVTFKGLKVVGTFLKWNSTVQFISDWRLL